MDNQSPNGPDIAVKVNSLKFPETNPNLLDTAAQYGDICYRTKFELADRSGVCGAGLCEIESHLCSTMTCSNKLREGTYNYNTKLTLIPF